MRWYIAGPMHGLPDHNYPAFKQAADMLRASKIRDVVSPTDRVNHVPPEPSPTYHIMMLKDSIKDLLSCEGIYLLDGWSQSRGVALELLLAVIFQYDITRLVIEQGGMFFYPTKFTITRALAHFTRIWLQQ